LRALAVEVEVEWSCGVIIGQAHSRASERRVTEVRNPYERWRPSQKLDAIRVAPGGVYAGLGPARHPASSTTGSPAGAALHR
jgi:hypothetical protein